MLPAEVHLHGRTFAVSLKKSQRSYALKHKETWYGAPLPPAQFSATNLRLSPRYSVSTHRHTQIIRYPPQLIGCTSRNNSFRNYRRSFETSSVCCLLDNNESIDQVLAISTILKAQWASPPPRWKRKRQRQAEFNQSEHKTVLNVRQLSLLKNKNTIEKVHMLTLIHSTHTLVPWSFTTKQNCSI